ncbi:toll-like receptor 2 [Denticeps clupeoides]|uniref:Toll-like receptor 2 n=1 Tax=Denticeps clupeoides TaxID=299321 RepID=A0AAY4CV11_9TELE|nr:toll-like receptor 2 [Denticeps clupeoides]
MTLQIVIVMWVFWGQSSVVTNACDCNENLVCDCSSQDLLHVPRVPNNVLVLNLSSNHIQVLTEGDLRDYRTIKILSIQRNKLQTISSIAFKSQLQLEALDLSFNQLSNLSHLWFEPLCSLSYLNILGNQYITLGPVSLFQSLGNLRILQLGNPFLQEVRKTDLQGLDHLSELVFVATNLYTYEEGSFDTAHPLSSVTLTLYWPFLRNATLVSQILKDVSHPETTLVISDTLLRDNCSVQPFLEVNRAGVKRLVLRNTSSSDEAVVCLLEALDHAPLSYLALEDSAFIGGGWWQKAKWTNHSALDSVYIRHIQILSFYLFSSLQQLDFLLKYLRDVSLINTMVFVMPCNTSRLMPRLEYLDLSQNLLSDMTIRESLCNGDGSMRKLRVLNVSRNSIKSLGLMSQLVSKLYNLSALDLSYNTLINMPESCNWPARLTFLNLSSVKLRTVTACLPRSLEILDLSNNDLTVFQQELAHLKELLLSGNKFMILPIGAFFPSLQGLYIQKNMITMFGSNDLKAYRHLQFLEAGQNRFLCSCDFVPFLQNKIEHMVNLTDGYSSYVCDSPFALRGTAVMKAHLSLFECHRILITSALCSGTLILLFVLVILCSQLHVLWYLRMTWAWLRAKRKPLVGKSADILYDAFVSYSEHDAEWVENLLVSELEGADPHFSLCLHKRNFLPGRWIVDNIIDCIEKSHRTLFVLSDHFVSSEWCRYELDFSHFRLVDEGNDSAVLILLEPIEKETIPKRFCKLRKIMNSRTYLEWPDEEEKRVEFWNNLKVALRREDAVQ